MRIDQVGKAVLGVFLASFAITAGAQATTLPAVTTGTPYLHLDADAGVTVNNGVVQQWDDQAAAGGNDYYSFPSGTPTLIPDAFNGHSVIRFDAGGDRLTSRELFADLNSQPITLFAVTQGTSNLNGLFETKAGESHNLRYLGDSANFVGIGSAAIYGNAGGSVTTIRTTLKDDPSTPSTDAVSFFETFITGGPGSGLIDDAYGTASVYPEFFDSNIGTVEGVGYVGDLAELVIYKGALSDTDRAAVESALGQTYGVPEPSSGLLLAGAILFLRRVRRH